MTFYIKSGNKFQIAADDSLDIRKILEVGNYVVKFDKGNDKFFLETVDSFKEVSRVYGTSKSTAERILNTFKQRTVNTGVMLSGEKGSGKTLLSKLLSIYAAKDGIPTILVNEAFTGDEFNKFIQDIDQPCVIIFDEFEKVYDKQDQEKALTLLDGVFPSKKLIVITCNDKWRVNEHMQNRPGRLFYMLEFKGLEIDFIREYCTDNLNNKTYIEQICQMSYLFDSFNFDMLKAIVEEMNRYDESPMQVLQFINAKPEYGNGGSIVYKIELYAPELIDSDDLDETEWRGNPMIKTLQVGYSKTPDSHYTWLNFAPTDIVSVDSNDGKIVYVNSSSNKLVLTRQKTQALDFKHLLV